MLTSTKMTEKTKKQEKINFEIEIPNEIEVVIEGHKLILKKQGNEITRVFDKELKVTKQGNMVIISSEKARKNERRKLGTLKSHINNMIEGLNSGYEYELEICNIHFPMTVTYDKAKSEFIIKNLLGEKAPRIIKVDKRIEVEIKAPKIKIKSYNIELAGQAAANLEKISKIRNRDRNKFQDGIFITKKPGVEFL